MKKILVISGKGGTGKTSIALQLIKLSNAKAIADCDVDTPNLHLNFSLPQEKTRYGFFDLRKAEINKDICNKCGLCYKYCQFDAITYDSGYVVDKVSCEGCGVCSYICPEKAITIKKVKSGEVIKYKGLTTFAMAKLDVGGENSGKFVSKIKRELGDDAELAIIDGPPGIGCPVIAAISGVDLALLVAEGSVSGFSDLRRIVKLALKMHVKIGVCINKYDIDKEISDDIIMFCEMNKIPFVGKVSYAKDFPNEKFALEVKEIYENTKKII